MYRIASSLLCNSITIKYRSNTSFNGSEFLLPSNFSSSSCGCCCAPFLNFFRFYRLLFYFPIYMCVSSPVQTSYIGGLLIVLRLALSLSLSVSLEHDTVASSNINSGTLLSSLSCER